MEISKHALSRYVERVMKISNPKERNIQLLLEEDIKKKVLNDFNQSMYLYTGQLGGMKTSMSYYLHREKKIGFVVTPEVDNKPRTIVTIFNISFTFPEDVQDIIFESLVNSIIKYNLIIEEVKESIQSDIKRIDDEIDKKKYDISLLESEIRSLKTDIDYLNSKRKSILNKNVSNHNKRDMYAMQLFGNTEFKSDINELK